MKHSHNNSATHAVPHTHSRGRYVSLALNHIVASYAGPVKSMRRGLQALVPDRAIRLCSWQDLQRLVCGENEIDLDVLKRNTVYE